jgi:hypothetical protein
MILIALLLFGALFTGLFSPADGELEAASGFRIEGTLEDDFRPRLTPDRSAAGVLL